MRPAEGSTNTDSNRRQGALNLSQEPAAKRAPQEPAAKRAPQEPAAKRAPQRLTPSLDREQNNQKKTTSNKKHQKESANGREPPNVVHPAPIPCLCARAVSVTERAVSIRPHRMCCVPPPDPLCVCCDVSSTPLRGVRCPTATPLPGRGVAVGHATRFFCGRVRPSVVRQRHIPKSCTSPPPIVSRWSREDGSNEVMSLEEACRASLRFLPCEEGSFQFFAGTFKRRSLRWLQRCTQTMRPWLHVGTQVCTQLVLCTLIHLGTSG